MICDGITTYYTVHLHYSTLSIFSIYLEESIWRLFPFTPSPLFYKEVEVQSSFESYCPFNPELLL